MDDIIKYITDTNRDILGWVGFIVDCILCVLAVVLVLVFLFKHFKKKVIAFTILSFIMLGVISFLLNLKFVPIIMIFFLIAFVLITIVYFVPEFKNMVNNNIKVKPSKQFLSNEQTKNELITTLIRTVEHLSTRKIGAIIIIEKEHNINTFIVKSVKLDALVTYELLNTIFFPETPLHDGAVIIRGNQLLCASAVLPISDKVDIPQQYGTRHRAGLGISEVSDAFTIVVSEETGQIATTIEGTITGNVSLEALKVSLNQHIIVR